MFGCLLGGLAVLVVVLIILFEVMWILLFLHFSLCVGVAVGWLLRIGGFRVGGVVLRGVACRFALVCG